MIHSKAIRHTLYTATAIGLLGCSTPPADRGLADVSRLVAARHATVASQPNALTSSRPEIQRQVTDLLAQPLNADRAVSLALLRSPALQVEYAKLGLGQADVLQASRLSNPVLSFSAMRSNVAGEGRTLDYGLVQNFTDLLFLKTRRNAAQLDLQRVKANVGNALQNLASAVTKAYYQLAHAEQTAQMQQVISQTATASSRLAERMFSAGNINALALNHEQAAATQAQLELETAQAEVEVARRALGDLIGLAATEDQWRIEKQLSLPVEQEDSLAQLHDMALDHRLDLAAKRQEAEAYARVLGLSKTLRWLPFLEVGVQGSKESNGARLLGPTVALELPIFGKSRSGVLRAEAQLEQASAEANALALQISNQLQTDYHQMLAARARFNRYRSALIPQRQAIVARTTELHHYMIVGQFDLLLAKQQEYDAYRGQLQALSDYWIARTELARELGRSLPSDTQIESASISAVTLPDLSMGGTGHAGHNMKDMPDMDHSQMQMSKPSDTQDNHDMTEMPDMDHSQMQMP